VSKTNLSSTWWLLLDHFWSKWYFGNLKTILNLAKLDNIELFPTSRNTTYLISWFELIRLKSLDKKMKCKVRNERGRERACVVCVRDRESVCVYVCVCVRERERELCKSHTKENNDITIKAWREFSSWGRLSISFDERCNRSMAHIQQTCNKIEYGKISSFMKY